MQLFRVLEDRKVFKRAQVSSLSLFFRQAIISEELVTMVTQTTEQCVYLELYDISESTQYTTVIRCQDVVVIETRDSRNQENIFLSEKKKQNSMGTYS